MRKNILASAAIMFCSIAAAAQDNPGFSGALTDAGTSNLIKSILGATRLPIADYDSSRVPTQVRVITADEINRSGAATLQQLLNDQPGMVSFDDIGNGYQQTLDMRGFNASPVPATVVFVDGVRVNEPDFGTINYQLIPLADVERIEILPGPQTIFGKNAMGGVINILTKKGGSKTHASVGAEYGSFDTQHYEGALDGPAGPLNYRLSTTREDSQGYRHNSEAQIQRFDGRLDYKDDKNEGSLSYQYGDDDLHQPGSLMSSEISADRRQNISNVEMDSLLHMATLNGKRKLTDHVFFSLNGFVRERLENTPLNLGRTSVSSSRSDKDSDGVAVQMEDKRVLGDRQNLLTAGAEWSYNHIDADSSGSFGGFPFVSGSIVRERQGGAFLQETFDLMPKTLILTGGVRYDRDGMESVDKITPSNDGSRIYNHTSPRVGLNYNPTEWLEAFVSLSDSFRTPTPDEISALGPFSATPELKPVKARSLEVGNRLKSREWGDASLSIFRTVVHDEIYPVFDPTAGFGQNKNIPKSRRDGVEVTLKPRWSDALDGAIGYSYTEATFQSSFVLDKAPFPNTQTVQEGDYLPQVPRHRLSVAANVHPVSGLTLTGEEFCVGSQFIFGDESNTERRLGAYCLAGARVNYERGPAQVFLRIDNLFNRNYETRGILGTNPATFAAERFLMPAPGISISGGVRYRIF